MARLKIITDQAFLHQKSKPVTEFTPRLWQFIDDMRETMRAADGVGLAAVQVGVLYRICIVDTPNGVIELVNPEILELHEQEKDKDDCPSVKFLKGKEGCLSVPKTYVVVNRPQKVTVRAQDKWGKEFTRTFEKMEAVIACHEIDHLDGVLITDKETED